MSNDHFYSAVFPTDIYAQAKENRRLVQDEQSMFGDQETFSWLIETVKPLEIVEIGSWKGHSANYMIDKCKSLDLGSRLVCVDTFLGGPEHWIMPGEIDKLHRVGGQPTVYDRFLANTLARGNQRNIFPLTADSSVGAEVLRHFGFQADLIFVDGAHDPLSVRRDVMNYVSLLSPEGVIFGDDYQYEPLARTVHECAAELGVSVLVLQRKWIFLNEALIRRLSGRPDAQIRKSFDGWVHP